MNTEIIFTVAGIIAGLIGGIVTNLITNKIFSKKSFKPANALELLENNRPEEWNEVRILNKEWVPDLQNVSLAGARLPLVNFRKANLSKASFENAILDGANFHQAMLDGANFHQASLIGANFDEASLANADMSGANLQNASFLNARLEGTDVSSNKEPLLENKEDLLKNVVSNPNLLDSLKPQQFENLVSELFSLSGYKIKNIDSQNDIGYDFVASKYDPVLGNQKFIIEVKRTPKDYKVGLSSLRALYAGKLNSNVDKAILVTTTEVTNSAKDFADKTSLQVITRNELINWLRSVELSKRT